MPPQAWEVLGPLPSDSQALLLQPWHSSVVLQMPTNQPDPPRPLCHCLPGSNQSHPCPHPLSHIYMRNRCAVEAHWCAAQVSGARQMGDAVEYAGAAPEAMDPRRTANVTQLLDQRPKCKILSRGLPFLFILITFFVDKVSFGGPDLPGVSERRCGGHPIHQRPKYTISFPSFL
jgi:hypothetical protein